MSIKQNMLKILLLIAIGISTLYIVIFYGLTFTELQFREWAKAAGIICTGIIIPFLGLLLIRQNICNRHEIIKAKGIIMHIVALICFAVWGFLVCIFLLFNVNEEKRLTKSLLIANEAEFLQENFFIYYEPVAVFFKKEGSLTQEKKQEYLEEKYGKDYVERYGGSHVHVYQELMELKDTLVEEVTIDYIVQALEELQIDRDYFIKEYEYVNSRSIYIELKGQEDISDFSKDVSDLFTYIDSKTDFFKEYRAVLYFYSGEEENRVTGHVPFGKLSTYDNLPDNYYEKLERMESLVWEKYLTGVADLEDRKAYEEEIDEIYLNIQDQAKKTEKEEIVVEQTVSEEEILSGENVTEEVTGAQGFFQEEAAKRIYEEYLEVEGFAFEVKYNAKGKLYIDLEYRPAGEAEDKSQTGFYGHKLVYDRSSKNGKCELFVLQRSHYTEDGMEESTVIVDMYTVETTTGQVVIANKQNWGDPGTEEYRKITGE